MLQRKTGENKDDVRQVTYGKSQKQMVKAMPVGLLEAVGQPPDGKNVDAEADGANQCNAHAFDPKTWGQGVWIRMMSFNN